MPSSLGSLSACLPVQQSGAGKTKHAAGHSLPASEDLDLIARQVKASRHGHPERAPRAAGGSPMPGMAVGLRRENMRRVKVARCSQ